MYNINHNHNNNIYTYNLRSVGVRVSYNPETDNRCTLDIQSITDVNLHDGNDASVILPTTRTAILITDDRFHLNDAINFAATLPHLQNRISNYIMTDPNFKNHVNAAVQTDLAGRVVSGAIDLNNQDNTLMTIGNSVNRHSNQHILNIAETIVGNNNQIILAE